MGPFTEKIAIVTGGASGIGRALGEELAKRDAIVVLVDVNTRLLDEAAGAITHAGGRGESITLDVTDFEAVQMLIGDTVEKHGRLDYIFNNAGIAIGGEVRDCTISDWRKVLDVNLYGVVNGVAAAYPVMVRQGFGHIINTASVEGLVPFPGTVSYAASKFGVVGLSTSLRIEGAELGVKVSVVCPGYIKTPIYYTSKMIKIDRQKMLESLPDHLGITPEHCALRILKGVERNKAIIVVTAVAKLLWLIQRTCPGVIMALMRRKLRESRQAFRIEA